MVETTEIEKYFYYYIHNYKTECNDIIKNNSMNLLNSDHIQSRVHESSLFFIMYIRKYQDDNAIPHFSDPRNV